MKRNIINKGNMKHEHYWMIIASKSIYKSQRECDLGSLIRDHCVCIFIIEMVT